MHQVFKRRHPTSKYTYNEETELVVRDRATKTNWGSFGFTVEIFKSCFETGPLYVSQAGLRLMMLCHSSAGIAGVHNFFWLNFAKYLKYSNS